MKKLNTLLVAIVGIIVFLVLPAIADTYQHNYTQICDVYLVDDTTTVFIDPVGYLWEVNDTDYVEGETAAKKEAAPAKAEKKAKKSA